MRMFTITLPYACFGIFVKDGLVVEAAPIGRWMEGKDGKTIAAWVAKKGGTIVEVPL